MVFPPSSSPGALKNKTGSRVGPSIRGQLARWRSLQQKFVSYSGSRRQEQGRASSCWFRDRQRMQVQNVVYPWSTRHLRVPYYLAIYTSIQVTARNRGPCHERLSNAPAFVQRRHFTELPRSLMGQPWLRTFVDGAHAPASIGYQYDMSPRCHHAYNQADAQKTRLLTRPTLPFSFLDGWCIYSLRQRTECKDRCHPL